MTETPNSFNWTIDLTDNETLSVEANYFQFDDQFVSFKGGQGKVVLSINKNCIRAISRDDALVSARH